MPSQSGSLYGLNIFSPIIDDETVTPSHDLQIREYLADLPTDERSPFALTPGTHLARLVVLDDVLYAGTPAHEEHLKSKYLIFESNCDADPNGDPGSNPDTYLRNLATSIPQHLDAIWSHCVGYPGASDIEAFVRYMKACQIPTTFYFAAINDKSLPATLRALGTQRAVSEFVVSHQGMEPAQLQREFVELLQTLEHSPLPLAGANAPVRAIKTGGHNE